MMSKVFEEINKQEPTRPKNQEGFMWLNILFKYDTNGNAEIVRSFARPAKDSAIKAITKPKKGSEPDIEIKKAEKEESLF